MDDVLEVYTQPFDPNRPQVCLDETSKQLLSDLREPIPVHPGQTQRVDFEYQREGVADLFMFFEPLAGKWYVKVTDQRTRKDRAYAIQEHEEKIAPFSPAPRLANCTPIGTGLKPAMSRSPRTYDMARWARVGSKSAPTEKIASRMA